MSGNQALITFFADQVSQAQFQITQASGEIDSAQNEHTLLIAKQKLAHAQAYLDIATKIKELFDTNRLTERRLKDALESLRRESNG